MTQVSFLFYMITMGYQVRILSSIALKQAPVRCGKCPHPLVKLALFQIPIAGGGYFRLFPYRLLQLLLKKMERDGDSLIMYFHPWEVDPEQPRMNGSILSRFRHYRNLEKTQQRLDYLLRDFSFGPVKELLPNLREYSPYLYHCSCLWSRCIN